MKIISSYGVELRKQNIPIRQTLEIYRSAVRYLVEVYESVWEELAQIEESKKRFNAAEHLVHTTKRNPARFDFDFCFPISVFLVDHPNPAVLLRKFVTDGAASIRRTIIHQNNLQMAVGLIQDGFHAFGQIPLHPVDGHNHADQGLLFHLSIPSRQFHGMY